MDKLERWEGAGTAGIARMLFVQWYSGFYVLPWLASHGAQATCASAQRSRVALELHLIRSLVVGVGRSAVVVAERLDQSELVRSRDELDDPRRKLHAPESNTPHKQAREKVRLTAIRTATPRPADPSTPGASPATTTAAPRLPNTTTVAT